MSLLGIGLDESYGHDIYTGIRGKDLQLCCGNSDCAATTYKNEGEHYWFLTRENHWIQIPSNRITFLPVPGDDDFTTKNHAHLCYRNVDPNEYTPGNDHLFQGDGQTIYMYCAFIPPGSI